jgi:thiamine pyrophosphate-dependent acetolactate synthase large subunit-like protein
VTGAEALVAALEAAGVEVAFGLPGVHNLAAWEALAGSSVRLVGVRHEQAAVYAADGYARASGRVGVAIVTTGPGAANTLGALGEAWASRSPVVVIATDIPTTLRREGVWRGVLHECADQPGMFAPVVKEVVVAGQDIGAAVAGALATAAAAPSRPVYVQVPTDLLSAEAEEPGAVPEATAEAAASDRAGADLDAAATLLGQARRPLVWAGSGAVAAGAGPAVAGLAERLEAPIVTTHSARGLVGDHPLAVGLPPHLPRVGDLWDEADLVVVIGSDLDGVMTQNWAMPQPPRLVAVNIDPADATKNYRADVVLAGDARTVTEALAGRLPERTGGGERSSELAELRAAARAQIEEQFPMEVGFLEAFAAGVGEDAVVLCDMCVAGYWLGALHRVPAPRKLTYPLGWGTLGCAFPQSRGAALADAGPVVSVSGDGGFLFACGELATARQESLPLTALIVDDGGYGMLRYDQARVGAPPFGVDLATPDFVALAGSFGIPAERVEGVGPELADALARHVAREEPTVLVASARLEPPPTTSPRWYRRR